MAISRAPRGHLRAVYLLAIPCLVSLAAPAQAREESYAATVDASHVHVRSGPGTEYYPTEILRRGERVEVCGEDAGGWLRIRPPRGSFSLVATDALDLDDAGAARVAVDQVEVHVGSRFGERRDVVQVLLDEGAEVSLVEDAAPRDRPADDDQAPRHSAPQQHGATRWTRIHPPADEYRWVHRQFLRAERNAPARDHDESRSEPGPSAARPRRSAASGIAPVGYEGELQEREMYQRTIAEPQLLGDVQARPLAPPPAFDDAPVGEMLDGLELEVAALANGQAPTRSLAAIEASAHEAWRRARTASDRNRAEILVRRTARMAGRTAPANVGGQATPAVYYEPTAGAMGLALGAINLAQFTPPVVSGPPMPGYAAGGACPPPGVMAPPPPPPIMRPYGSPLPRHYVNLDALGLWVKSDNIAPALVTTSPVGTPQATAGILGLPTTSVLYGNQNINGGIRPGGRIQGGVWVVDGETLAVEGHYWALATKSTTLSATSTFSAGPSTDPILARPFFNNDPLVNAQDRLLVAFPNFTIAPGDTFNMDGSVSITEASNIQSAGGGVRWSLSPYSAPTRVFLLGGYRFFQLDESLSITSISTPGSLPFFPGVRLAFFDYFGTRNTFNGGDIGLGLETRGSRWSLGADARLAMGNMNEAVSNHGALTAEFLGFTHIAPGGLLVQPTNAGDFSQNRFAIIPSVDVKLGYQVARPLRLTVGYNFTYVTRVLRPGGQIDSTVNGTQIGGRPLVGPASPTVLWDETSLWLQGITGGFDLTF